MPDLPLSTLEYVPQSDIYFTCLDITCEFLGWNNFFADITQMTILEEIPITSSDVLKRYQELLYGRLTAICEESKLFTGCKHHCPLDINTCSEQVKNLCSTEQLEIEISQELLAKVESPKKVGLSILRNFSATSKSTIDTPLKHDLNSPDRVRNHPVFKLTRSIYKLKPTKK